ncbi:hypothetical protein CSKR_104900 [Clonorchis sinensis]|uniref:Uncharacterized protein n=1 Tax=Clonorchis sinensis TaxID=79923 RepID=A0A3R7CB83_CLOSI|nr:hypothetical protein CSKR_104900 [Clonorchis sinensis]
MVITSQKTMCSSGVVDQMAVDLFAELGNWLANVSSPVEETSSVLNCTLTMSPRLGTKRLQANCQARRTDQLPSDQPHPSYLYFDKLTTMCKKHYFSEIHSFVYQFGFDWRQTWNPTESLVYNVHKQLNVPHKAASVSVGTIFEKSRHNCGRNALLIRLLKILRQPTTGFALVGAHQVGAVPECWGEIAQRLERERTDRKVRGSNPASASRLPLSRLGQPGSIPALVLPSGGMAARHRKGATAERLGQPGSIPALVPPWGGMEARHRKTATPERFFSTSYLLLVLPWKNAH